MEQNNNYEVEAKESVMDKIKGFGKKGLNKAKEGFEWAKNNPENVVDIAIGAVSTAVIVGATVVGISDAKEARRSVYSKDIGESVVLKKKLSNKDKIELDYRMKNGETKIEALDNLDLIKK